jgi:hypothetical protein
MAAELCTLTAPVSALLDRLAALIEDGPAGVPDFPLAPEVTGFVSGAAPANHFLCQQGMRIFKGNAAASAQPPAVVIFNHAKATRHQTHFGKLWNIPVTVQFHYDRTLPPSDLAVKADQLELLLFTDYEDETAAQRLSVAPGAETEGLRVRHLEEIDISEFRVGDDAWTIVQVVFTAARCSGLQATG